MASIRHLGDFLRAEMQNRDMSAYALGDFIGVSHTTINKLVEFGDKEVGYPSLEFMIKLARATKLDIRYLIMLVVPEDTLESNAVSPEFLRLSERIERLPAEYRKVVEMMIDLGLDKE